VTMRRRYVDIGDRQVHVGMAGPERPPDGTLPLVLLHQTPRSIDEFAEVVPLLAERGPVVAVDLPGMGASDSPPGDFSIEAIAADVIGAIVGLGIDRCDLAGHHTGGVVALEIAAVRPDLVDRLVLSSTPFVDAAARDRRRARPSIDAVTVDDDGRFLVELWDRRRSFYPPGRPDLLVRFVADALRAGDAGAGHRAVSAYEMERRVGDVAAPTLLVGHAGDPHAFPDLPALRDALERAGVAVATVTIDAGMVPLEFTAEHFTRAVSAYLARSEAVRS
jgi:pimeloyl-ACP methyl ester carboxylesterase